VRAQQYARTHGVQTCSDPAGPPVHADSERTSSIHCGARCAECNPPEEVSQTTGHSAPDKRGVNAFPRMLPPQVAPQVASQVPRELPPWSAASYPRAAPWSPARCRASCPPRCSSLHGPACSACGLRAPGAPKRRASPGAEAPPQKQPFTRAFRASPSAPRRIRQKRAVARVRHRGT
jgi:hypothetical protein